MCDMVKGLHSTCGSDDNLMEYWLRPYGSHCMTTASIENIDPLFDRYCPTSPMVRGCKYVT